jgi:hypothetical protein
MAGPFQRGLIIGTLIYFLGAATGLAFGDVLVGAVAFDVAPLLALPLVARQQRSFAALCWLALAGTVPLAIGLHAYAGLIILPTAPLLALAAFRGPRRWWPAHPAHPAPPAHLPHPAHLLRNTALISAACAYGLLLAEAVGGAL